MPPRRSVTRIRVGDLRFLGVSFPELKLRTLTTRQSPLQLPLASCRAQLPSGRAIRDASKTGGRRSRAHGRHQSWRNNAGNFSRLNHDFCHFSVVFEHFEDVGVVALKGDEVELVDSGAQLDIWRKNSFRARNILMRALGNDLTFHVFDHRTASAAWTSLLAMYEPKLSSNLHSLFWRLTATR